MLASARSNQLDVNNLEHHDSIVASDAINITDVLILILLLDVGLDDFGLSPIAFLRVFTFGGWDVCIFLLRVLLGGRGFLVGDGL